MRAMMPSFASVVARCAVSPMTTDEKSSVVDADVPPVVPIAEYKPALIAPEQAEPPFEHTLTLVELAKSRLHDISDQDMIVGVGMLMDKLALKTQALPFIPTKFDAPTPLNVSITNFIGHIIGSKLCSRECCVLALVYGQRLLAKYPNLTITNCNIHRLFLIAIMLASKLIDDRYCRNNYYATIGHMDVTELNRLEMEFCFLIGFDLNVTLEEFSNVCDAFGHELRSRTFATMIVPTALTATSPPHHPDHLLSPHTMPPLVPIDADYSHMACYPPPLLKSAASLGWGNLALDPAGYPMPGPSFVPPFPHDAHSDPMRSMTGMPPLTLAAGFYPPAPAFGYAFPGSVASTPHHGYIPYAQPLDATTALWLQHQHPHRHHPAMWPLAA